MLLRSDVCYWSWLRLAAPHGQWLQTIANYYYRAYQHIHYFYLRKLLNIAVTDTRLFLHILIQDEKLLL
jgi:hypothetical protein